MDMAVTVTGNVGSDVEHRVTRTGLATAQFRLACTPRVYREGAWQDQPTTWIAIECFRGLADNVSSSLRKGDPVVVQGRLRTRSWTDTNAVIHERLVIEATTLGHDLNRGTSAFRKVNRILAAPMQSEASDAEDIEGPEEAEPEPTQPVALAS